MVQNADFPPHFRLPVKPQGNHLALAGLGILVGNDIAAYITVLEYNGMSAAAVYIYVLT